MASLTTSQIEILRRLDAGRSLYSCDDIPRFLEEIVFLSRLRLISISKSGAPRVTADGSAYLRVVEEITGFTPLETEPPAQLPSNVTMVAEEGEAHPLPQQSTDMPMTTVKSPKGQFPLSEPED